jgi:hypothetical protein
MLFHLRPSSSSITSNDPSFSSDNSSIPASTRSPLAVFHELVVRDLDDISSLGFNHQRPIQRATFRIPRPILTIPRPAIHVPTNNTLWTSDVRPTRIYPASRPSTPSLASVHSERPLYQNLPPASVTPPPPPPPPPPRIPSIRTQYQIEPSPSFQQFIPVRITRPIKQKKIFREKPLGLFTTLSAGGFKTIIALIYLILLLGLPIAKLVLGILYVNECPVNKNIPLYAIISGACGLAAITLLLLSSACTYCRYTSNSRKSTHRFMICIIAFSRGMQGALAVFLFIWFFFGNVWVFGARYRVQTDKPNDINNYCNPTLYWFTYYVLIFTYVYAILTCCIKFCVNFFCCGACDIWYKAFL